MPISAWIVNLVVLTVVLEADLGHRKIVWFRLLRPLLVAGVIIAYYLAKDGVSGSGKGLAFELALAAGGIALGLLAGAVFRVRREADGLAWSDAGFAYAVLWLLIIGARLGFVYTTTHTHAVEHWLAQNQISALAVTDALIFMAVGLLLARTGTLLGRALASGARLSNMVRESRPAVPVVSNSVPQSRKAEVA
jgi:hypothetical protein